MKRVYFLLLFLILFQTLFISQTVSASDSKTIRVGIYQNSPKIFIDEKGQASGFWPDILAYIAAQEGWKLEYVPGSWSECLQRLQDDQIDIMPDVAYTDARNQIYAFSTQSVYTSWSEVYTLKRLAIQSIPDLEGKTIAVLRDSVNVEGNQGIKQLARSFGVNCTIVETDSYEKVFELVQKGQVDGGVASKDFGYQHIAAYNLAETPIIFQPSNLYFAFSKNADLTPYLIGKMDFHIQAIKDNKDSIYYQSLRRWIAQTSAGNSTIPGWIWYALAGVGGLVILLVVGSLILRSQISSRTRELTREINEHKQAREATRRSESKYATLVEHSNDGIIIIQDGKIVFVNHKMIEFTARSMEEVIGKPFLDFLTPKCRELVEERYHLRTLGGEVPNRYDAEISLDKGRVVEVEINASLIEYQGKPATMAVVRDTTERNKMWATLRDRETRLSVIYDNVSDIIFVISVESEDNFRFKSVNRRFLDVTGLSEDQIVGKLVKEIIPEPSLGLVMAKYKEAIVKGHAVFWEEVSTYPSGIKYGEVTAVPVMDSSNKYTELIGTVHDITERKHTDQELAKYREHLERLVEERTNELKQKNLELAQANLRLQELDRMKSVFLASMSHELRTPLNSIIGFTGILLMGLSGTITDEQRKQLTMVKGSSEILLSLINDILDISKIEAGKVELNLERFSLGEVIKGATEPLLPIVKRKGLTLTNEAPDDLILYSDMRRIKQILMNLLSNAVKFTEYGSVKISARMLNSEQLEIRVIDTGVGIKSEEIGKLFQPFQQVGASFTKKYEGTGLGLYLTSKLLTLLGGSISVKSEYQHGSEFICILPIRYKDENDK